MANFIAGLNKIFNFISQAGAVVLLIALALMGVTAMFSGAEGKAKLKEDIKTVISGSALVFGAGAFAKEIMSWFA